MRVGIGPKSVSHWLGLGDTVELWDPHTGRLGWPTDCTAQDSIRRYIVGVTNFA